ncbi:precorrin-3B synthase [Gellertiella hungarica]|uniref:Precorrin-3B synthase n=1 Tax=Gellertiella hungarica TaxID=1572859 RepID=A0A7W6NJ33_9HYPH|nr:precorrin-3B synthase [Gellertiella hungarica]MBB4063054.1 precorrin-3B synthase [Gellertiella hungarica]
MTATAPLFRTADDLPVASTRRGVCPSLSKPMQTGDGLLVRLRPASGGLAPRELVAIAEAARLHGNGILEVTARGNLQIRGLRPETVAPLTEAVFATGIDLATGLAVETPPLSGIDPSEAADTRPLAARIRAAVAGRDPAPVLAAKLSVIVDGGGLFNLDAIVADIRLKAVATPAGTRFALLLAGDAATARPVALLTEEEALEAILLSIGELDRLGREVGKPARGRDLDLARLSLPGVALAQAERPEPSPRRPAGLHRLASGALIAGFGLTYCQAKADDLIALAEGADALGICDMRLAPEHGLLVPVADAQAADRLLSLGEARGFLTRPDHPANHIALCAGTAGCASAFYDTHALASLIIAQAPDLLDGSFTLHLSGCPKGCAHPPATLLGLSGASLGYGLVVNGSASASPEAYIAANDVASAVARLAALVRTDKQAGESTLTCLNRLGTQTIAAALRRKD